MLVKLTVFIALITIALAADIPKGLQPQLDGRIVDGEPTSIRKIPWQISIQRFGSHLCGGSIYSPKIVVTAAHCMTGIWFYYRVRAGSSLWISGGVETGIDQYRKHKRFNKTTYNYDIAVIRLSISLSWSLTIKPIGLTQRMPENGALATVSGWGHTKYHSDSMPTQLKVVEMQILNRKACGGFSEGYGGNVTLSMICAYAVGKDACQGDSGGPLVSDGVLVGVVSAGLGCGENPGLYTNVKLLRSWIIRNAEDISRD